MISTTIHPDETERFRTAQALWQQGQVAPASALLHEILARHPGHLEAADLFARLLQSQGQLNAASQVMMELCRQAGMDTTTTVRCAEFILQCQRHHLAAALCDEAFARGNASPALHALAGNIANQIGEFESARKHFLTALDTGIDLNHWFVLGMLATTQRYATREHPDFARFIAHFQHPSANPDARAATGFGLAKAYDDIGAYAEAAQTLREANRLSRQVHSWPRGAWERWLAGRMQSSLPETRVPEASGFVPVFIVGLPRSGTTLAATQIARHNGVRDRGELPLLNFIAERLSMSNHLRNPGVLHEAAELYRRCVVQDDPPVRWYIDKDPNNFRYLDLIATLFPQARVIHCRRDRRDAALSIWSQDFSHPHYGFANDLDDIAAYIRDYDKLMQHWRQRLDLPMFDLDYESMTADPEATVERLRAFIGLPSQAAASAAAPASSAPIASASMWQARQPIYRSSVGRWKNYLPHIPELARIPTGGE